MKLVVLASGRGSNFAAIADAVQDGRIAQTEIVALVSNNPEAGALEAASQRGIRSHVINSRQFKRDGVFHRQEYEEQLHHLLQTLRPDYICLAGYMLILGEGLVGRWPHKIINIHPSLLPAFRGLKAQKQALEAGVRWTGCTVHLVTAALDDGPILVQTPIEIRDDDTEETLSERLLPLEHQSYVEALQKLSTKRWEFRDKRVVWKEP